MWLLIPWGGRWRPRAMRCFFWSWLGSLLRLFSAPSVVGSRMARACYVLWRPPARRSHAEIGVQASKGQHARSLEAYAQKRPSFLFHSVSRSKSESQIHGIKKRTLLSERRGRPGCTGTGWREILVLFANRIPPQAQLLGHYPVTLQVGQGGYYP